MSRRTSNSSAGRAGKVADAVGLVGELILVMLYAAVLCIPLVTLLPVVGVLQWRMLAVARGTGFSGMWRRLGQAMKWGWLPSIGMVALVFIAWFNYSVTRQGVIQGAAFSAILAIVVAAAAVVVALRAATLWTAELGWRGALQLGAQRALHDPLGSVVLLVLVIALGAMALTVPWLLPVVPGALIWGLCIIESRRRAQLN